MKRECTYRNCNKDISEMRKDAKFCCVNCKTCERKYKKRKKLLLEKYKQKGLENIKLLKIIEIIKKEDNII